ncbi:hypothetical protein GF337_09230 [candidate division KSB1 bacterium]|nr:hypothetical protein [candidate division KSB1 bacterium]
MIGKSALIVVFGFILSFSVYQLRLNKALLSATDTFNYYYMKTLVHEEALNAMNFGINKIWQHEITDDNFTVTSNGCTSNVSIYETCLDTVLLKVKTWNYGFVQDHYDRFHESFKFEDSVFAYFSYRMPVSRYFWFTNNEGSVYWVSGDTVWGPTHTNSILRTYGRPVFYGKVTAYQGISPSPTHPYSRAKYYGGWEIGVRVEIPTDMSHLIQAATTGNGPAPMNTKSLYNLETTFEFLYDGRVVRTVGADSPDTVLVSDIAPTGVVHSTADVRVKGALNGQLTIYSEDDIWIDDDIVYASDPISNPACDDFLGLVSGDNVIITDNDANNSNVYIQACMMAIGGSFVAENYQSRPVAGNLDVTGSIVQKDRGPVGTFGWWGITSGFYKQYRFDTRCASQSPPSYPFVRALSLVSWWE